MTFSIGKWEALDERHIMFSIGKKEVLGQRHMTFSVDEQKSSANVK